MITLVGAGLWGRVVDKKHVQLTASLSRFAQLDELGFVKTRVQKNVYLLSQTALTETTQSCVSEAHFVLFICRVAIKIAPGRATLGGPSKNLGTGCDNLLTVKFA